MRRNDDDARGDEHRLGDVVGHQKDALESGVTGAAPEVDHLRAQVFRGQDIERAERLVHAQHFGLGDQRPREADSLAHAARQLLRVGIFVAGQADELERAVDLVLFRPRVEATLDEPDLHVLLHGEPGIEREALKDDGEATIDAVNGDPWLSTAPCVGRVSPAIRRMTVDLPEPDCPNSASISPSRISRLMSSSTVTGAPPSGALVRLRYVPQLDQRRRTGRHPAGHRKMADQRAMFPSHGVPRRSTGRRGRVASGSTPGSHAGSIELEPSLGQVIKAAPDEAVDGDDE